MNLIKSLRMFRAVADARSFSLAAEELAIAQPPVSRGIAELEKHLGVRLFDRSRRQIRLTPTGRNVLPEAIEILRRIDSLAGAARPLVHGSTIGVRGFVDPAALALAAASGRLQIGGHPLRLIPVDSIEAPLESGDIDAAFDVLGLGAPRPISVADRSSSRSRTSLTIDIVVASTRFGPARSDSDRSAGERESVRLADLRGMPPGMRFGSHGRGLPSETITLLPTDSGLLDDPRLLTEFVRNGIHLGQMAVLESEFAAVTDAFTHGSALLCTQEVARRNNLPFRKLIGTDLTHEIDVVSSPRLNLSAELEDSPEFSSLIAEVLGAKSAEAAASAASVPPPVGSAAQAELASPFADQPPVRSATRRERGRSTDERLYS